MAGGVEPPDRTGGGNGLYSHVAAPHGSFSATSVMTGGGGDANDVKMRSFAEIIASEQQDRNIHTFDIQHQTHQLLLKEYTTIMLN